MEFLPVLSIGVSICVLFGAIVYGFSLGDREAVVKEKSELLARKTKEFDAQKNESATRSDHMMTHARDTAQRILQEAMDRSQEMLAKTDQFQRTIEEESHSAFLGSSYEYSKKFEAELQNLIESYKEQFARTEKETFTAMKKAFDDEQFNSATYLKQNVEAEFKKAQGEIEQYKADRIKAGEEIINKAVVALTKQVLSKSITTDEHKKLISLAIEKAKEEGIFQQ
jgi:flagellar biosynthesis/type III secretory pathway protein FliH